MESSSGRNISGKYRTNWRARKYPRVPRRQRGLPQFFYNKDPEDRLWLMLRSAAAAASPQNIQQGETFNVWLSSENSHPNKSNSSFSRKNHLRAASNPVRLHPPRAGRQQVQSCPSTGGGPASRWQHRAECERVQQPQSKWIFVSIFEFSHVGLWVFVYGCLSRPTPAGWSSAPT